VLVSKDARAVLIARIMGGQGTAPGLRTFDILWASQGSACLHLLFSQHCWLHHNAVMTLEMPLEVPWRSRCWGQRLYKSQSSLCVVHTSSWVGDVLVPSYSSSIWDCAIRVVIDQSVIKVIEPETKNLLFFKQAL